MSERTHDPDVLIETRWEHGVRYRSISTGRCWDVIGQCDQRGDCLIGVMIDGYGLITSHADIEEAKRTLGVERLVSDLDVPVTPEFDGCCPFTYREHAQ